MHNYKAVIEYDGSNFHGFQIQPGELRTVQCEILKVLNQIFNSKVDISYAGRTDSGVHAVGQVINFKVEKKFELHRLRWSLNLLLPEDISVKELEEVSEDFDSRHCALWRKYNYFVVNDYYQSVFLKKYSILICKKLDINLMNEACKYFLGEHDFSSFCSPDDGNENKVKDIFEFDVKGFKNCYQDNVLVFNIKANSFLYNMVRIMIGTVLEVGKGLRDVPSVMRAINLKDVSLVGSIVDPKGLFLMEVGYN